MDQAAETALPGATRCAIRARAQQPFLDQIGDKGVRSLKEARAFILDGPIADYKLGHGMFVIVRLLDGVTVGISGLLRRDTLEYPDLGYALLQAHWSRGYATEATAATIGWAFSTRRLDRIVAVTAPDNVASIALL